MKEKGLTPIVFIFGIIVISGIIVGASMVYKKISHPNQTDMITPTALPSPTGTTKTEREETISQISVPSLQKYILFEYSKVSEGDLLEFKGNDSCIGGIKAKLSAIDADGIKIEVVEMQGLNRQWYPKNIVETGDSKNEILKDGSCRSAPPLCMDVAYEYCFGIKSLNGILNVDYNTRGESTMPSP